MKEYTHYGVTTTKQYTTDVRSDLRKQGIDYTDLPLLDIDVLTYISPQDGSKRYAVIRPVSMPDDYEEAVYITDQYPDDGDWLRLIADIEDQEKGAEPLKMPTRLSVLLKKALEMAYKVMPAPNNPFAIDIEADEEALVHEVRLALYHLGYNKGDLAAMDRAGVDTAFLDKILS